MNDLSKKINIIISNIEEASDLSNFFDIACKITFLLQDKTEKEKEEIAGNSNIVNSLIFSIPWTILNNTSFFKIITDVLREEKNTLSSYIDNQNTKKRVFLQKRRSTSNIFEFEEKQKKEKDIFFQKQRNNKIKDKQLIQTILYISPIALLSLKDYIKDEEVIKFGKQFNIIINKILQGQKHEFAKSELVDFLNQITYDSLYHFKKDFLEEFNKQLKSDHLFKTLSLSRDITGCLLITCSQDDRFSKVFKKVLKRTTKNLNYKREEATKDLSKPFKITISNINEYIRDFESKSNKDNFLRNFISLIQTETSKNMFFILSEMTLPLRNEEDGNNDLVIDFINNAKKLKDEVGEYFKANFSVFQNNKFRTNDWSNKLFLISIKTLSILEQISEAKDVKWKCSVFHKEYRSWMEEINNVLNKHNIEDDWEIIKKHLVSENTKTEWKSSFITSTQEDFTADKEEKVISERILQSLIKPIIGMMNTDGGTILVGVVENPLKIVRKNVKENLHVREQYTFFNISFEFKSKKTDLDKIKRSIHDKLMLKLHCTADKFNELIFFKELEIQTETGRATIIKIDVIKSVKFFYSIKEDINKIKTYTLFKRADGRTCCITDLKEYLKEDNNS